MPKNLTWLNEKSLFNVQVCQWQQLYSSYDVMMTHEDYDDKYDVTSRPVKGMHGNLGAILKEIGVVKGQM